MFVNREKPPPLSPKTKKYATTHLHVLNNQFWIIKLKHNSKIDTLLLRTTKSLYLVVKLQRFEYLLQNLNKYKVRR